MTEPQLIKGNNRGDNRGNLTFNNNFSAIPVKRVYTIANSSLDFVRAWQGHRVEQRWFSAITGSFRISLVKIDNWESPSKDLLTEDFILTSENFDILHIPGGFVTAIQALEDHAKLLIFANYDLNEIQDEFRFPSDYFNDFNSSEK